MKNKEEKKYMERKKVNKNKLIPIRKEINQILMSRTDYDYSGILIDAYNGEGFYISHRSKVIKPLNIYGYDIHWAYGGVLLNHLYPLTSELTTKKLNEDIAIVIIELTYIKNRYKDFYYTLYKNNICFVPNKKKKLAVMTTLDYEIFNDLYINDSVIVKKFYFKEYGTLGLNKTVEKYYKRKKDDKDNKTTYEAAFYGMFAKRLYKDRFSNMDEQLEYHYAASKLGARYQYSIRNKQLPIAIFQTAYIRYKEWKQFKKNIKNVIYMNTDSIYCDKDFETEEDKGLGCYSKCYNGEKMFFIRRNAYCMLDDNNNVLESTIGGVINGGDMTKVKIEALLNRQTVKAKTLDIEGNEIEVDLKPNFILAYYGIENLSNDLTCDY